MFFTLFFLFFLNILAIKAWNESQSHDRFGIGKEYIHTHTAPSKKGGQHDLRIRDVFVLYIYKLFEFFFSFFRLERLVLIRILKSRKDEPKQGKKYCPYT